MSFSSYNPRARKERYVLLVLRGTYCWVSHRSAQILEALLKKPMTYKELVKKTAIPKSSCYEYIHRLKRVDLVWVSFGSKTNPSVITLRTTDFKIVRKLKYIG